MTVDVTVPGLCVRSTLNLREHWAKRAKRQRDEKLAVWFALASLPQETAESVCVTDEKLTVHFTRMGGRTMDDDNLAGAFKACRDQVAKWLLRDDSPRGGVVWTYDQKPGGPVGVRIQIQAA